MRIIIVLLVAINLANLITVSNCSTYDKSKWSGSPFGKEYLLRSTGDSFLKSITYCNKHGGRLAVIGSINERSYLLDQYGSTYQYVWLGSVFDPMTKQFRWLDHVDDVQKYIDVSDIDSIKSCTALLMKEGQLSSDRCSILVAGALCEKPLTSGSAVTYAGKRKHLRDMGVNGLDKYDQVEDKFPRDPPATTPSLVPPAGQLPDAEEFENAIVSQCEALDQIKSILRQFDGSFARSVARMARQRARRQGVTGKHPSVVKLNC
ncbi:hypothetical protein HDE_01473 [Halotydeus destructor]|nr:hypothetical protein HDE_01473 [Halotydeus destructor]